VDTYLDINTLILALVVVYSGSFLLSIVLYFVRQPFPGAWMWLAGQGFLVVGTLGLYLQGFGLPYHVLALSNGALLQSLVFQANALWKFRFASKRFPASLHVLGALGVAVWFALVNAPTSVRIYVFSGTLAALSAFAAVIILYRPERHLNAVSWIASVYFLLLGAGSFVRVVGTATGTPPLTILEEGTMGASMYLAAMLTAIFNMLGYFLMSSSRAESILRDREAEAVDRTRRLAELVSMKDSLLSVIGHDLRAPVSSAARYVRKHLLEGDVDLNTRREGLKVLADSLERSAALLENLLNWARGRQGALDIRTAPVSLAGLAAEASSQVAEAASQKGVTIEAPDGDAIALADSRATATVLRNILSNAVKYSRPGDVVRVGLSRVVGPAGEPLARAVVSDGGVGMQPQQIEKLFLPGKTLLTLGTDGEQGTGFGLALCKAFMDAMHGSIEVDSRLGVGSTFTLTFPAPPLDPS